MKINNLSDRERLVADLMWSADSPEELALRLRSLPREDQLRAKAIAQLLIWGGDEVENTQEAQRVLAKFRLTTG